MNVDSCVGPLESALLAQLPAARRPRDCGRGHFVLGSQAGTPPTEAATKQRAEAQRLGAFSRTVRCVARGISFNSTVSQCQFAF